MSERSAEQELSPERTEDPVLAEAVRLLVAGLHPREIYLFGSRARGDSGPQSDYDFLVILPEGQEDLLDKAMEARRALLDLHVAKDVLVMTEGRFEFLARAPGTLPATVLREGRRLYPARELGQISARS